MEPVFREHAADMADREATMVLVERTGLLEVEDEVEQSRQGAKDSVNRHGRKSHLFPLLGTYRRMCGLVGADVVKIFVHRRKHEQR